MITMQSSIYNLPLHEALHVRRECAHCNKIDIPGWIKAIHLTVDIIICIHHFLWLMQAELSRWLLYFGIYLASHSGFFTMYQESNIKMN